MKPELQQFRAIENDVSIIGENVKDVSITSGLIGTTSFRDFVTGDAWHNQWVGVNSTSLESVSLVRIIVYMPRRPNTPLALSSITEAPDPNEVYVFDDRWLNKSYEFANGFNYRVPLGGRLSIYDQANNAVTKGDLRCRIFWTSNAALVNLQTSFDYRFTNK